MHFTEFSPYLNVGCIYITSARYNKLTFLIVSIERYLFQCLADLFIIYQIILERKFTKIQVFQFP